MTMAICAPQILSSWAATQSKDPYLSSTAGATSRNSHRAGRTSMVRTPCNSWIRTWDVGILRLRSWLAFANQLLRSGWQLDFCNAAL